MSRWNDRGLGNTCAVKTQDNHVTGRTKFSTAGTQKFLASRRPTYPRVDSWSKTFSSTSPSSSTTSSPNASKVASSTWHESSCTSMMVFEARSSWLQVLAFLNTSPPPAALLWRLHAQRAQPLPWTKNSALDDLLQRPCRVSCNFLEDKSQSCLFFLHSTSSRPLWGTVMDFRGTANSFTPAFL